MTHATSNSDVVLVSAPFASIVRPSLGLGLLKSALGAAGIKAEVLHLSLQYAAHFGAEVHEWITEVCPQEALLGEWLFSPITFSSRRVEAYRTEVLVPILGEDLTGRLLPKLIWLRSQSRSFIGQCGEDILKRCPRIIGFSTTFQQTNAALMLAAIVKARRPETVVVFGGANCEGKMGKSLLATYACIDHVFSGAAENTFPDFVVEAVGNGSLPRSCRPALSAHDMDQLPIPDFDDYFLQLEFSGLEARVKPGLVMETSRGCFWGMQSHCKFCGLNGTMMKFRRKSGERVLREIRFLTQRYKCQRLEFVDNVLAPALAKSVFSKLAEESSSCEFFCEILPRAHPAQLDLLARGGLKWVQTGIETLHETLINRLGKGGSVLQRLEFLRYCLELNIRAEWNFLYGIPGETESEYADMLSIVPFLQHLPPPTSSVLVRPDRFSPYFEDARQRDNLTIRPLKAYKHVFDAGTEGINNSAYFYEFEPSILCHPLPSRTLLLDKLKSWKTSHARENIPRLEYIDDNLIHDSREVASKKIPISTQERWCLDESSSVVSIKTLQARFEQKFGVHTGLLHEVIMRLDELGLVVIREDALVSVVVRRVANTEPIRIFPGGEISLHTERPAHAAL